MLASDTPIESSKTADRIKRQRQLDSAIDSLTRYREHKKFLQTARSDKEVATEREECRSYAVEFIVALDDRLDEVLQMLGDRL